MLTKEEILSRVWEGLEFPPLRVKVEDLNPASFVSGGKKSPDLVLSLEWENRRRKFVVECKGQSAPSYLVGAIEQVRACSATTSDFLPMVIVPYLGPGSLERLIAAGVSGLDLCGNGVVNVPGEWFVYRTGEKNRFPTSLPIKNVYRGASSIVARAFLSRPKYESVNEVREEILKRKGDVSLSTVSKVLKALQEDLLIGRNDYIRLLQPERLLDLLRDNYRRPNAPYVILPSSNNMVSLYVSAADPFLREFGFEETGRFPNVELLETDDPTVYFDRRDLGPIPYISPLQAYLELSKGGKREQEAAEPLRDDILTFRYEKR
ncbi:MAG: hypothetical protein LC802_17230 [Acidobacteria bacterium]|nr:hypothetical protein [Acidobacteriota bacterium]